MKPKIVNSLDAAKECVQSLYKNPKDFCCSERKTNFKKMRIKFIDETEVEVVLTPRQMDHFHRCSHSKFTATFEDLGFVKLRMGNPILLLFISSRPKQLTRSEEKFQIWYARKRSDFRKSKGISESTPLTPQEKKDFDKWLLNPKPK